MLNPRELAAPRIHRFTLWPSTYSLDAIAPAPMSLGSAAIVGVTTELSLVVGLIALILATALIATSGVLATWLDPEPETISKALLCCTGQEPEALPYLAPGEADGRQTMCRANEAFTSRPRRLSARRCRGQCVPRYPKRRQGARKQRP